MIRGSRSTVGDGIARNGTERAAGHGPPRREVGRGPHRVSAGSHGRPGACWRQTPTRRPAPMTAPLPFEPDDDDRLIGRVMSRREVLALFGVSGVALAAAACAPGTTASGAASGGAGASATAGAGATAVAVASGLPSCVVVPELTEGPYFVDEGLDRSDIRVDTSTGSPVDGTTLRLDWVVSMVDGDACAPLEGVLVDVWHCDAQGVYSDVQGFGGPRLPARLPAHGRERRRDASRRSTPAGTRAARSTSTSRSGPTPRRRAASSSPRSSSSTRRPTTRSSPRASMRRRARPMSATRMTGSTSRARG